MASFNTLYIDKRAIKHALAKEIRQKVSNKNTLYFDNLKILLESPLEANSLILTTTPSGSVLKKCPGTNTYSCCNYYILDIGENCPFSCGYCILQDYFKHHNLIIYVDFLDKLNKMKLADFLPHRRIGTGQFTDSLALDEVTGFSAGLISYFEKLPSIMIELKTKSVNINNLLKLKPIANAVISWSLNPEEIITSVELNTPTLATRINAAKQIAEHGFKVGFHFDPIILYDNCLKDYLGIIEALFLAIPKDSIKWISMGTLRFTTNLKHILTNKQPLFKDEFVVCEDNKYRYIRHRRVKAYKTLLERIKHYFPTTYVYLCMESPDVWQEVFGFRFENNGAFEQHFNESVAF